MKYAFLSGSGVAVSRVCVGTATFGVAPYEDEGVALIRGALDDFGVNFVDTANSYGNQPRFDRPGSPAADQRSPAEAIVGRAIKGRRDEFVVSSKVSEPVDTGPNGGSFTGGGLSRLHILSQIDRTLERLGTDHIDIYYAHHPDRITSMDETVGAFDDLVRLGKIRYWALSTFPAWRTASMWWEARDQRRSTPVCLQQRYNLWDRRVEREVLEVAEEYSLSTTAFSPLAGGLFAGEMAVGRDVSGDARWGGSAFTADQLQVASRFNELAREWGHDPASLAIAWLLGRPSVASAIVGPESTDELAKAAQGVDIELTEEQVRILDDLPHQS